MSARKQMIASILADFRNGKLTEEQVIASLEGKKSSPNIPDYKLMNPEQLLECLLNVSSLLLGNRLPTEVGKYAGIPREHLFKLLNQVGGSIPAINSKGRLDAFKSELDSLLNKSQQQEAEIMEAVVVIPTEETGEVITPEVEIIDSQVEHTQPEMEF